MCKICTRMPGIGRADVDRARRLAIRAAPGDGMLPEEVWAGSGDVVPGRLAYGVDVPDTGFAQHVVVLLLIEAAKPAQIGEQARGVRLDG